MNASAKLIDRVVPATVAVKTVIPEEHPSASVLGTERLGSGVLVDSRGLILTVNYIVMGARSVEVFLLDDKAVEGRVVAQDFASGLAIVEIDAPGPPALSLCPSKELQVGQEVFIVAAAAEHRRRVNDGVITALAPFDAYWEYSLDRAIITSAMNPGLGGGALLDMLGRVAGIVSLDLGEVGRFTMAIPIDDLVEHLPELLRHGRRVTRPARAWIGLYCYTFKDHVVIAGVLTGAPGERAGLKAGDVVLAVDGQPVSARHELYTHLWSRRPGEQVRFRILRNNEIKQVAVESANAEDFFA